MSLAVSISSLSVTEKTSIRNDLTIQSILSYQEKKNGAKPKIVSMYTMSEDTINIPYVYATSRFNGHPNFSRDYPIISIESKSNPREYQESIVAEATELLNTYRTVQLDLYTSCGKTFISAYLACKIKLPTVILYNISILTEQWKNTFIEHTNAKVWVVDNRKPPSEAPDIIVTMIGRVSKIPQSWIDRVGLLIID
jgi:superfamily II DNA or RNA helicase